MDTVTNTQVAVTLTVPLPPRRMWDRISAVTRIGEWSPEATGAHWWEPDPDIAVGARFTGRNRFPNGLETTVTCVVVAAEPPATFAWTVLDDAGLVGSTWHYELRAGPTAGSTVVRHSFTHGPGASGTRSAADTGSRAFHERLAAICRNMADTVTAMAAAG
ncbi:SRPBCC family protein [Jidongwangia harbinensis]|uniref:SRPBCC family protein n=1 Tax=Jidongwangia harbinensis TaxID=2878561 RepID=UPI001CD94B1E|nr:SRPBCC family protein [Jidongwangia harbinensis]MCA2214006.1 SRPBCC family protein [Jidongwangia harbinensis]